MKLTADRTSGAAAVERERREREGGQTIVAAAPSRRTVTVSRSAMAGRYPLAGSSTCVDNMGPSTYVDAMSAQDAMKLAESVDSTDPAVGLRAVASLRISEADPRPRHRGISHHSLTAYGRVALQSADVVVLSDGFWKRHFGGSPAAIGQTVRIDERPHTIVGVMPSRFTLDGDSEDYFQPLGVDANRNRGFLRTVGRLRRGVTLEQARDDLSTITRRLERLYPDSHAGVGANLVPVEAGPEDAALFAEGLLRRGRTVSTIVGQASAVQALWADLDDAWLVVTAASVARTMRSDGLANAVPENRLNRGADRGHTGEADQRDQRHEQSVLDQVLTVVSMQEPTDCCHHPCHEPRPS